MPFCFICYIFVFLTAYRVLHCIALYCIVFFLISYFKWKKILNTWILTIEAILVLDACS